MTALILTPFACSGAVLACSFLGLRPLIMACTLPFVVDGCWVLA